VNALTVGVGLADMPGVAAAADQRAILAVEDVSGVEEEVAGGAIDQRVIDINHDVTLIVHDLDVVAAGIAHPVPLQIEIPGTAALAAHAVNNAAVSRANQGRADLGGAVLVGPDGAFVAVPNVVLSAVNSPELGVGGGGEAAADV